MNTQPRTMISDSFSRFATSTSLEQIPADMRDLAKHLILDGIGVGIAASTYDFSQKTFDALHSAFGAGDSDVIGFPTRLPMRDAMLMNGALIHGLDYDDTYTPGLLHSTASALPCVLATAASLGRCGRDMLAAYILGMEVSARIAGVSREKLTHTGFHPSGVVAAFGCTIAAGLLHGLTAEQLTMAQGIVLSMAAGTREYSTDGAWTKRVHPGWAAVCGVTAVGLAKGGFVGPRAAYEGRFGLFPTHLGAKAEYDLGSATDQIGEAWEIRQVAVKPFPACQLTISSMDAAIAIAHKHDLDPAQVASVDVLVQQHAVNIVCEPVEAKRKPKNAYAAQFSIPFTVACALIHRKFGLAELAQYKSPDILALAANVNYHIDPKPGVPQHYNSSEVIVHMKDGRKLTHREEINRGGADRPMKGDEIVAKFMDNAALSLPQTQSAAIRDMVLALEKMDDVKALSRAVAKEKK
jgi:2-methylcitrate dehydratase PrpD